MIHESQTQGRDDAGRFQHGNAMGATGGRPRGMGPARTLEALIKAEGASLFELAFKRAQHDDAVLAATINLIASAEMSSAVAQFRLASTQAQGTHQ